MSSSHTQLIRLFAASHAYRYATLGDQQDGSADRTPEQAHMQEGLTQLVEWRNLNEPDLEVWLTEFGWDTAQGSPDRALAYGPYSAEEVQGMWLVRGYLLGVAAGLDRGRCTMHRAIAWCIVRSGTELGVLEDVCRVVVLWWCELGWLVV